MELWILLSCVLWSILEYSKHSLLKGQTAAGSMSAGPEQFWLRLGSGSSLRRDAHLQTRPRMKLLQISHGGRQACCAALFLSSLVPPLSLSLCCLGSLTAFFLFLLFLHLPVCFSFRFFFSIPFHSVQFMWLLLVWQTFLNCQSRTGKKSTEDYRHRYSLKIK